MDYRKHYNLLIEKAKKRTRIEGYYEEHHILPKCLKGTDTPENLVNLTAREHFVAHWLLYRCYPRNKELSWAFKLMSIAKTKDQFRYTPSSRAIAEAMEAGKQATSEHLKGVRKAAEHIAKVAHSNKGKKRTEEVKKKLSLLKKGKPSCRAKGVFQLDMEDNVVGWFRTTKEAQERTGILSSNIGSACKGVYTSSGGFKWRYGLSSTEGDMLLIKEIQKKVVGQPREVLERVLSIIDNWHETH